MKIIIDLDDLPLHNFSEVLLANDKVKVKGILINGNCLEVAEYELSKKRVTIENK